jgi:uncharacterized membrane protein
VAGFVVDEAGFGRAARWSPDGTRTDFGFWGTSTALNRAGTVVGYTMDEDDGWQIDAQGHLTWLAPLPGDTMSQPDAINAQGWIAGASWSATGVSRCVVWRGGAPIDLGLPAGATSCIPWGINSAGHMVGVLSDDLGHYRGFFWRDGAWTIIGTPEGTSSDAVALNDDDVVVGLAGEDSQSGRWLHPFVWKDGKMTDLSGAFPGAKHVRLESVVGIDARGRIFLNAHLRERGAARHAIVLVPQER